jgi:hypothetical protein
VAKFAAHPLATAALGVHILASLKKILNEQQKQRSGQHQKIFKQKRINLL